MKNIRQKPKSKWHYKILKLEKNREYSLDVLSNILMTSKKSIMKFFTHWGINVSSKKKVGRVWLSMYNSNEIIKRYLYVIKYGKDFEVFSQDIFMQKVQLFIEQSNLNNNEYYEYILS